MSTAAPARASDASVRVRRRLHVTGVVQGVGFRPFVHRLARREALGGWVRNEGWGVVVEVEGEAPALDAFAHALVAQAPQPARVDAVAARLVAPRGECAFSIEASVVAGRPGALVPPDLATCGDCLRELGDPDDRRYRYPFINCTACGPRLTIVRGLPYDRGNTTMAAFEMCAGCRAEYEDLDDRRFHAEPIACPECGPRLSMPLEHAVGLLRDGAIVAVKGLGGWHLACDATNASAVARLRARKQREEKPFAVMSDRPAELVELDERERALLCSPARPIVLARRVAGTPVAEAVAPGERFLGVMLPYTPLHHLLAADTGLPLVMTSGNRTDEPIAVDDKEARAGLAGIADAFLGHDRAIYRRCEDSVVRCGFPLRRSRGYAPAPLPLPVPAARPLLACGGELKSTFCLARGREAFLSPHLGDMSSPAALAAFHADRELYAEMVGVRPEMIACDAHPGYRTSAWARAQEAELVEVQHHHAHAAACLAEHGESGAALALVFDGTGYGPDGTLWGGELLRCDLGSFERIAHLEPVPLPGGEAAIREPWRTAAAYLERAGRPVPWERWDVVRQSLRVNAPRSSGMGRLFDAVAALAGVGRRVSYEGQAAVELERLAGDTRAEPYRCKLRDGMIVGADLVRAAHDDLAAGRGRAEVAAAFHEGVALAGARACEAAGQPRLVVLSGGCFQNLRLLASTRARLRERGFRVLSHRLVPPNDGGLSYGQAAVAARRITPCA